MYVNPYFLFLMLLYLGSHVDYVEEFEDFVNDMALLFLVKQCLKIFLVNERGVMSYDHRLGLVWHSPVKSIYTLAVLGLDEAWILEEVVQSWVRTFEKPTHVIKTIDKASYFSLSAHQ